MERSEKWPVLDTIFRFRVIVHHIGAYYFITIRGWGGHLKLRKISYLWYYMGRYLNLLFKFSFIYCYGPRHKFGRGWAELEREREGNVLRYWSDVSRETFVTGPLKSHPTPSTHSQVKVNKFYHVIRCSVNTNIPKYSDNLNVRPSP